ncbi:Protein phosphatase 2C [Cynara cardunculus var. scolymus]|uniref:Protein phosphatase 2C n=1 Tax=Cynara cardunculus var. scolymus TaxID=59895 RepID=A0A103TZU9_CYNCS|nr:Protein phosphatase 2C [Cynara cardunculus var. scolymus]
MQKYENTELQMGICISRASPEIHDRDYGHEHDYGMENGAFGGVFDGHGRNGQIVSKFVRNMLPSLIVNQRNSTIIKGKTVIEHDDEFDFKDFHIWKDACFSAFKVMDKEIKLMEHIDFSYSGITVVIVIKQR